MNASSDHNCLSCAMSIFVNNKKLKPNTHEVCLKLIDSVNRVTFNEGLDKGLLD